MTGESTPHDKRDALLPGGYGHDEFVFIVGQVFQVRLAPDEVAECTTVRRTADVISRKVALGAADRPLKPSALELVRSSLKKSTSAAPQHSLEGARLQSLFPRPTREQQWADFARNLGIALPGLQWPGWVKWVVCAVLGAELAFLVGLALVGSGDVWIGAVISASSIVLALVGTRIGRISVPSGYTTPGDVARQIVVSAEGHAMLNDGDTRWSQTQILEAVEIVAEDRFPTSAQ